MREGVIIFQFKEPLWYCKNSPPLKTKCKFLFLLDFVHAEVPKVKPTTKSFIISQRNLFAIRSKKESAQVVKLLDRWRMLSSDRDALRDFAGGAFICNEHTEYHTVICIEHRVQSTYMQWAPSTEPQLWRLLWSFAPGCWSSLKIFNLHRFFCFGLKPKAPGFSMSVIMVSMKV